MLFGCSFPIKKVDWLLKGPRNKSEKAVHRVDDRTVFTQNCSMIEHFAKVTRLAMSALKFKIRLSYAMLIILWSSHCERSLSGCSCQELLRIGRCARSIGSLFCPVNNTQWILFMTLIKPLTIILTISDSPSMRPNSHWANFFSWPLTASRTLDVPFQASLRFLSGSFFQASLKFKSNLSFEASTLCVFKQFQIRFLFKTQRSLYGQFL